MSSREVSESLRETLAVFGSGRAGEPLTTSEVTDCLDVSRRSTYERLDRLADRGLLETKKVGAKGRVWWRPVEPDRDGEDHGTTDSDREEFESFIQAVEEYAIFRMDADGRIQSWNDGAERIKGYEADEIIGEHFSVFYTDEDREAGVPERNLAAATKEKWVEDEGWRLRADGTRFWANVTITAIRDDDGELKGFTKVTRDMTDRREYERRLREERDLNEQILETAPAGIFVVDSDGDVVRANDRFRRQVGLDEEAADLSVGDLAVYDESGSFLPPEERPYSRVLRTGEPVEDWLGQVELPSGERRWASLNAAPIAAEWDGTVGEAGDVDEDVGEDSDADVGGTDGDSEVDGEGEVDGDSEGDGDSEIQRVVVAAQDVTRLRRQEEQLERQRDELEHELGEVFDRVDDAFVAVDEDWQFTHVNEQAARLLDRSVGELVGRTLWETFPAAVDTTFQEAYERAFETQETVSFEEYFEPLATWFEVTAYPSESGLSIYFRDVTERKERERRLEQYEQIVETVDDGIYAVDDEDRFVLVNEAYCELTGYDREELVGAPATTVYDAALAPRVASLAEAVAAGDREVAAVEVDLETKGGDAVPCEARFGPFPLGEGRTGRCGVVRDVSERKARERKLARFRRAVEASGHAIYMTDTDGRITYVNSAFEEMTGYPAGEAVGETPAALRSDGRHDGPVPPVDDTGLDADVSKSADDGRSAAGDHPVDIERTGDVERPAGDGRSAADEQPVAGEHPVDVGGADEDEQPVDVGGPDEDERPAAHDRVWEEEIVDRRKDGELYYAEQTVAPVTDEDGAVIQYIAVQRDVTDRKRFEERLKLLNQATRDLLTPAAAADVGEVVVETITNGFDLPGAVVYTYDPTGDELVPASRSGEADFMRDTFPAVPADDSSLTGHVYSEGVARYFEDVTESPHLQVDPGETAMRTGSFIPIGDHGILVVGATSVDAFDADTRGLIELLAANAEAALARVEHESELERRIRQQDVVTDLGQRALEDRDLDALMAEAAERVAETLDTDYCKVLDLDEAGESLLLRQGVGWRDGVVGEATVSAVDDDSQAAYTLTSSRPVVVADLDSETRFSGPDLLTSHDVSSGISTIIGPEEDPWGILGTHDTAAREFTRHDVNFVQSVANILATAITRHADEQALIRQREQLAALNSLNRVVREVTDAVIDQSTREEIEATVCEYLADTDSYEFAWVGEVDHTDQTVTVRTETGVEGYLDDVTISVDPDDEHSDGPTGRALRTVETQTTQDIREDPAYEPWRERAEAYGYRSSAAVPIVHDGTTYGVLNVYADRPHAFTGRERTVVSQLGEVVGHAIAAIERKRALMTDEVVELGFHISDVFGEFDVDPAEGAVTIDETVPLSDDEYLVYGTTTGDAHEVLTALVERLPHWESVTFHDGPPAAEGADGDGDSGESGDGGEGGDAGADGTSGTDDAEATFELRLTEPPVLSTIASVGGTIVEAAIEEGTYHMTVQVPPGAEVRRVIETVQEAYPGAEMVTRRQTTRDAGPVEGSTRELADELTDRQHAVLRAAYHAGFFEWPRKASGEDVADSLGVSAPTFHQHLRKAEMKVLDAVIPALS